MEKARLSDRRPWACRPLESRETSGEHTRAPGGCGVGLDGMRFVGWLHDEWSMLAR